MPQATISSVLGYKNGKGTNRKTSEIIRGAPEHLLLSRRARYCARGQGFIQEAIRGSFPYLYTAPNQGPVDGARFLNDPPAPQGWRTILGFLSFQSARFVSSRWDSQDPSTYMFAAW